MPNIEQQIANNEVYGILLNSKFSVHYSKFKNNLKHTLFYLILLFFFAGCNNSAPQDVSQVAIAKAGNSYLYADEIKNLVPMNTPAKDSLELLNKFIDNWIHEALVIQKAENNLTEEQKNVDKQLQEYRS